MKTIRLLSNKIAVLFTFTGLLLTLILNLSNNFLFLSGVFLLLISLLIFILNIKNKIMSVFTISYLFLIVLLFTYVDSYTIFDQNYFQFSFFMFPLLFILLGVFSISETIKEKIISNFSYLISIICITYLHFLLIAVIGSGV